MGGKYGGSADGFIISVPPFISRNGLDSPGSITVFPSSLGKTVVGKGKRILCSVLSLNIGSRRSYRKGPRYLIERKCLRER